MFQRRMLLVANRLQNTQMTAPKLFSSSKKKKSDAASNIAANDVVADEEENNFNNNNDDPSQTNNNNNEGRQSMIKKVAADAGNIGSTIKSKAHATASAIRSSELKDFDTVAFELRTKSLKAHRTVMDRIKRNFIHFLFLVYFLILTSFS